ncbi:hypothetical protein CFOL_v3_31680 [Cephalotus follicularis]|uniref:Uncharacterized protein n=1 Tax=Cephalotus follicularis TaxID=3775 RepID=A0A1Q3D6Z2_CEPFO|nr:hypothetical protein CFOL_v3_31680 [Cephalotus follicularis]
MEPPKGFLATLWNFICFLPYFIGLLLLGIIKGVVFCPLICLIATIGNSAIILGMWPVHIIWTYYCIVRAKILGSGLKIVLCICIPVVLILWPVFGIVGSIIGGAAYGLLSPIFATFDAVGEGKTDVFFHCFYDGTWSTIEGIFTIVRDFKDVCLFSYFSVMDDLQKQEPPDGKPYEIRFLYLPGVIIIGVLGFMVDMPVVSVIALFKSPYMLFKGWQRLLHDLIGREGPFLETICVPFAGLAILLWPLAVVGAVLGSMVASIFLGAYAGVVVYQESSFWLGLCYIITSLALYDEYSNDVLAMREGSCFPRPYPRMNAEHPHSSSLPISRTSSLNSPMVDLKPFETLVNWFNTCERQGQIWVSEGLITLQDIEDAKSGKGSKVVSIGLPAYCILQMLLRSVKANSQGLLLGDGTEITSTNRPKDTFFDWFLNPFLIIKDQIKAENLNEAEEEYFYKLVLLCGDPERLKNTNIGSPPESELKRAELDALARRLQGITRSISRYPTCRRHFECLLKTLSENLAKKNGSNSINERLAIQRSKTLSENLAKKNGSNSINERLAIQRSKSAIARIFSQKSFKRKSSYNASGHESQPVVVRELDIV